jgi:flagellar M-ring protein FliF
MLTLNRGIRLSGEQIHSISQLVSAAVPGMGDGHVTITDQKGRMLTNASGSEDPMVGSSQRQMDMRRNVEDSLTRKAQDMLDLAIGAGKAIVRVSADIDFRRIERHNETYDAEGRVLFRETISTESSSDPIRAPQDGYSRVAVGDPASAVTPMEQGMSKSKREDVDSEYRVPSGKEIILDQGGRIERLSVSVSVAKGAEARSAEELKRIERMVQSAVGAVSNGQRQDSIEVVEMPFQSISDGAPQTALPQWWMQLPFSPVAVLRTLAGIAMLMILLTISRRTFRTLSIERENVGVPVSMLAGADGSTHALGGGAPSELGSNHSEIEVVSRLAEQNPSVVATWIDHTVRSKS